MLYLKQHLCLRSSLKETEGKDATTGVERAVEESTARWALDLYGHDLP